MAIAPGPPGGSDLPPAITCFEVDRVLLLAVLENLRRPGHVNGNLGEVKDFLVKKNLEAASVYASTVEMRRRTAVSRRHNSSVRVPPSCPSLIPAMARPVRTFSVMSFSA
jgi:hypothetical protein